MVLNEIASVVARRGFDFHGSKALPEVKESFLALPVRSIPAGAPLETGWLSIYAFAAVAADDLDLLIVDAGALQERSLLSARERARLQKMELPLLWFGPDAALPDCDRDRWLRLQAPLNKEDLRRGLAQCLGATGPTKVPAGQAEQAPDDVAVKSERKARKKINTEANTGKKLIELVEVVDDEPA